MQVSVTLSNRRVRTRTHGGVAGVSGQPLPLCRSNGIIVEVHFGVGVCRNLGRLVPSNAEVATWALDAAEAPGARKLVAPWRLMVTYLRRSRPGRILCPLAALRFSGWTIRSE